MAGDDDVEVRVVAGEEFARVMKVLREQDKALAKNFRKELRIAVLVTVKKVQEAALAIHTEGRDSSGLRKRMAKGVALKTSRTAQTMRIITRMKDPSEAMIPRGFDFPERGWRHPVFGDREHWVTQHGDAWFIDTIGDDHKELAKALVDVLDKAAELIAAAGT